jgi:PAS domain S-box-containing protein
LRQAEEELRQFFSSVSDYVWSCDVAPDGKLNYRYYSPVAEKITGRPPEFYMAGPERWLSTVHPEDRSRLEACTRAMITERLDHAEAEYRIVLPDESIRWVRDSVTATKLENGGIRLNGVVSDITERKDAEQERLRLEGQLRQSQRLESLGVLAGGIAHDFNNILTSILGFSSLVEADLPDKSPQKANVREVLRAGERAKQLVQQILTFSQRQDQDRRPIDVAAAVSDALRMLRGSLPYNVELRQRVRRDSGLVLADFSCIQQVVLNLATNACHALEPSGGVLEIALEPVGVDSRLAGRLGGLKSGQHVKLTVADNGPGIDAALRERIFDPFFTTKEVGKGTGLGLSMVHGIVSNYGGVIHLESAPRQGATFAVYLPQAHGGDPSQATGQKAVSGSAAGN